MAPKTGGAGVDRLTAGETASYDYNADMLIKPASLQNRLAGGTALSLDGHFDFRENANIGSSTVTPHASVRAEWSGGREAYSFTVHPSDAGTTLVTFDIDETDEIDTVIRLYQSNGTPVTLSFGGTTGLVADDSTVDSGSNISLDSFATARLAPGTYIIEVGRYEDRQFTTPAAYTLHVSFDKAEITTNLENAMEGGVAQGFAGNDVILSGAGDDTLDGGADNDTVSFENASQGVIASLYLGAASGHGDDRLTGFENLIGSDFGDTLLGNAGPNRINGRAGDDVLEGRGDNDTLDGGDGNDTAVFSGNRSAYTVTAEAGGFRLVDTRSGTNDGSDLALNIEVFKFADSTVAAGSLLPNAAPTAPATKAVTTLEDTASALTAIGAADADGDLLTYSIKAGTAPTKGSVAFSGGSFTYTPSANANGPDSFTIRIQDSKGASVEQRVSVTITPVNDIPDAVNDGGLVTPYQTALVTSAATLLGNDTDADGDALSIQSVQGAAHGSVGLVAGNVTFTPDAGYSGSASYTYTISDGRGGLDTATVNLTVSPPRATAQAIMTPGQSFGVTGFQGLPTDVFISGTAAGHETITVGDFTTATFSNNFTAGGDTIRLAGRASEFSISVSGNLVSLASTINEAVLKLPVGFNTTTIVFETAPGVFGDSRVLKFFADGADADSAPDLFLGAQRVMPDVAALPITAFA